MSAERSTASGLGEQLPAVHRLSLADFAGLYPTVPLQSVVRCVLDADREAEDATGEGERDGVATRLARRRLDELAASIAARTCDEMPIDSAGRSLSPR